YAGHGEGLLCGRCGRGGRAVSRRTIELLAMALRTGRFGAVSFSPAELSEAGSILDPAIALHVSRPFRAIEFLREMGG
ncbi:MAG: DNA repair protein RecO C-terminal domain-containing protein, partial [Geobacteraceae bacterium]|nr:DNA repair protein RecO C-terminal domain-containing protein [Geobacteraceae bacterium]